MGEEHITYRESTKRNSLNKFCNGTPGKEEKRKTKSRRIWRQYIDNQIREEGLEEILWVDKDQWRQEIGR